MSAPSTERLGVVVQLRQVEVVDRAHALAAWAHAALVDDIAHHDPLALALVDGHRSARRSRRDVERERGGRADLRLPDPAEEDAQHRVGVGGGADRGARVGAHPLLVDEDRGRQPFEDVDLGPCQRRHEPLHEGAVGLVDQPLRLGGDRAEHQRALARAGDAGEHRQPALRELDAEVLEVVHARAVDADQIVVVGSAQRRRPLRSCRVGAHSPENLLGQMGLRVLVGRVAGRLGRPVDEVQDAGLERLGRDQPQGDRGLPLVEEP